MSKRIATHIHCLQRLWQVQQLEPLDLVVCEIPTAIVGIEYYCRDREHICNGQHTHKCTNEDGSVTFEKVSNEFDDRFLPFNRAPKDSRSAPCSIRTRPTSLRTKL